MSIHLNAHKAFWAGFRDAKRRRERIKPKASVEQSENVIAFRKQLAEMKQTLDKMQDTELPMHCECWFKLNHELCRVRCALDSAESKLNSGLEFMDNAIIHHLMRE